MIQLRIKENIYVHNVRYYVLMKMGYECIHFLVFVLIILCFQFEDGRVFWNY